MGLKNKCNLYLLDEGCATCHIIGGHEIGRFFLVDMEYRDVCKGSKRAT